MKLIQLLNIIKNDEIIFVYNEIDEESFYGTVEGAKSKTTSFHNKNVEEIDSSGISGCIMDIRIKL